MLFPFPNRIRDGRFTWDGRTYQLPLNDPAKKNAIHGFACRHPWRVVDHGADAQSAWVTVEFRGSLDAPECRDLWPADYELTLTIRLGVESLATRSGGVQSRHETAAVRPRLSSVFQAAVRARQQCGGLSRAGSGASYWPLTDSLPNGDRVPSMRRAISSTPRRFGDLKLDDVLTDISTSSRGRLARLRHDSGRSEKTTLRL